MKQSLVKIKLSSCFNTQTSEWTVCFLVSYLNVATFESLINRTTATAIIAIRRISLLCFLTIIYLYRKWSFSIEMLSVNSHLPSIQDRRNIKLYQIIVMWRGKRAIMQRKFVQASSMGQRLAVWSGIIDLCSWSGIPSLIPFSFVFCTISVWPPMSWICRLWDPSCHSTQNFLSITRYALKNCC